MSLVLLVGFGGFLGSIGRYILGISFNKLFPAQLPYSTVLINLLGSLLIGVLITLIGPKSHPRAFHFLVPGILGGFTTFSAFSGEVVYLLEKQLFGTALLYIAATVL